MTTLVFGEKKIGFCPYTTGEGEKGVAFTRVSSPRAQPSFTPTDVYFQFPNKESFLKFLVQLEGFADHFED